MISSLEGKIILKSEKYAIIEVNGIGFRVNFSEKTLSKIPQKGQNIKVWTFLSIRETSWDLFGFLLIEELEFFELLISIPGIGPKTAMNILGAASVQDLEEAIVLGNEDILGRVSGIGKKMAQKIVIELRTKIKKLAKGSGDKFKVADEIEIIDALVALGYRVHEAREAIKAVPEETKGIENRVKEALKRLGKK